jgi:hypothetical protein
MCIGEYGVFINLFLQGFSMAVDIASELKFFNVKLDEFTPIIPTVVQSEIHYIYNYVIHLVIQSVSMHHNQEETASSTN